MHTYQVEPIIRTSGLTEAQIEHLFRVFQNDLHNHLPMLKTALGEQDPEVLRLLIHKLYPGFQFFGCPEMDRLAHVLEDRCLPLSEMPWFDLGALISSIENLATERLREQEPKNR